MRAQKLREAELWIYFLLIKVIKNVFKMKTFS